MQREATNKKTKERQTKNIYKKEKGKAIVRKAKVKIMKKKNQT